MSKFMDETRPRVPRRLLAALALSGRSASEQKPTEVFVREPGHRFLEGPKPAAEWAKKDSEFAWLSLAAYGRIKAASGDSPTAAQGATDSAIAEAALNHAGWTRWDFPDYDIKLLKKMRASHLRVEIWEKKEPPSVAVAFGGTIFHSGKDWKSNLRWFLPFHEDEYTEIVKGFGPAFVREFSKQAKEPRRASLKNATIFSTGHSLGGGLAQQFAYSMPIDASVPRVKYVYAFDPSPVTGFYSVDQRTRNSNKKTLSIDRIYERGELLAIVRSLTSFISPPSAVNPCIRGVRYSLFYPANPIEGHSMRKFALKLQKISAIQSLANAA